MCAANFRLPKIIGNYDWFFMKLLLVYLYNEFLRVFSQKYLFVFLDILKGVFQHFLVIRTPAVLLNSRDIFRTQSIIYNGAVFAKTIFAKNLYRRNLMGF